MPLYPPCDFAHLYALSKASRAVAYVGDILHESHAVSVAVARTSHTFPVSFAGCMYTRQGRWRHALDAVLIQSGELGVVTETKTNINS
jgi:hypothetical protein